MAKAAPPARGAGEGSGVMATPLKRGIAVVDMLEWMKAKLEKDLRERAQDSGDEFCQARARRGLIALRRLRRRLSSDSP
jgi:hypothetical protein